MTIIKSFFLVVVVCLFLHFEWVSGSLLLAFSFLRGVGLQV